MTQKNYYIPNWLIPAGFVFYLVVNIISWQFPFFWDTLLTSTITTWFHNNGWSGGIIPAELDAGHPPLFYGYLLSWWKISGPLLTTSHLAMLPLLWIMYYQFVQLSWRLLSSTRAIVWASVLFCMETTILAQSTMVSYDIAMLCFYLFGLRYIIDRKPLPVAMAAVVLSLISLRGVFAVFSLFITELFFLSKNDRKFNIIWKYLPAVVLVTAWSLWHQTQTGWMLFSPSEKWSDHRGIADIGVIIHNVASIIRIHLEPGRALLYLLIAVGLTEYIWKRQKPGLRNVLTAPLIPLIIFSLAFLPFSNPIGHRYFMIVFALSILLLVNIAESWSMRRPVLLLAVLVMISGHFWIWPDHISKGWDSSLGHVPYFKAKNKMDIYLADNGIEMLSVAAHFPLDVSSEQSHLTGSDQMTMEFEKWDSSTYVLQSNINNDFSESELEMLQDSFTLLHEERNKWIYVRLYQWEPEFDYSFNQSMR